MFPDALVFLHGDKRVALRSPRHSIRSSAISPPPEYLTMLVSEARRAVDAGIHQDKAGYYLKVDGDQKVGGDWQAAQQKSLRRHAKPMQTATAAPAAAPAAGAASAGVGNSAKIFKGYALTELSAAGLLYNAKAKEIYYKALGPLVKESWLAKLDGPSSEGQAMKVATTIT